MRYLGLLAAFVLLSFISPIVLVASAQSARVVGIPQLDCPVVIEQQENARDGSLDWKN